MKRSFLSCAVAALCLAAASSMTACATDQPLTPAQKLAIAQDAVEITCDLAQSLAQSGQIHGKDAENAALACATARSALVALQTIVPPAAAAASSPG